MYCRKHGPTLFEKIVIFIFAPVIKEIQMAFAQIQEVLEALNTQLTKVATEITTKLDELYDAIEEAGEVPPAVEAALVNLQATVDALDAIVPDAVEEPEVPEEPVVE